VQEEEYDDDDLVMPLDDDNCYVIKNVKTHDVMLTSMNDNKKYVKLKMNKYYSNLVQLID